jgi:Nrap protein domain 6
MQDYSAIIRLIPNRCTRYIENLSPEAEYFTSATPKYRNLVARATELGDQVYVQFDPAQYLVEEIQVSEQKDTRSGRKLRFFKIFVIYLGNFFIIASLWRFHTSIS